MTITANFKSDRVYRSGEEVLIGNRWFITFNRYNDDDSKHYGADYCSIDAIVFSLAGKPLGESKISRIEINEDSILRGQDIAARHAISQVTGVKFDDDCMG